MITIYMHENTINGKCYIGQTSSNLSRRKRKDWSGYKGCSAFYNAIQKHGGENFETHILEYCETFDESEIREQHWMDAYDTHRHNGNGYNLKSGSRHGKHSFETRRKLSEFNKGRSHTDETRSKMSESQKGKKLSDETRRKLSQAHKGKTLSDEHRQKLSEAKKHPVWEFAKYIIRLYRKGWSKMKIARYYGCSSMTICSIIKDYELKHEPQHLSLFL